MKKNNIKLIFLLLFVFLLTGCATTLTNDDKKIVKYNSEEVCKSCTCESTKKEYDNLNKNEDKTEEDKKKLLSLQEELNKCESDCKNSCSLAKENETGQNLVSNILCKPTDKSINIIYKKYGVDIDSLPACNEYKAFSSYEGLWISIFVRPLAWALINLGLLLNNIGLSLMVISILIRVLLMPLTKGTAMQSENLKKAQPEIDRINKKYENKNTQEAQAAKAQETMLVYKKYNINPLSSCLFALIQIPLLFAFIEAINRTPAIFEGKFLGLRLGLTPWTAIRSGYWWYIIIVIILAGVTYLSLNLNKTAGAPGSDTEKQMNMMNKIMLVFITYASFTLSTAICIYWISSSLFTVIQNLIVKKASNK